MHIYNGIEKLLRIAIKTAVLADYNLCILRVGVLYIDRVLQFFLILKHQQSHSLVTSHGHGSLSHSLLSAGQEIAP